MKSAHSVLILAVLLSMVLVGCGTKSAGQGQVSGTAGTGGHKTSAPQRALPQVLDAVAATDEQRAKVQRIMDQSQRAWQSWWRANQEKLGSLLDEERQAVVAKDGTRVDQLVQQHRALVAAGMQNCNPTWTDVRRVLNSRQRAQLDETGMAWNTPGVVHKAMGVPDAVRGGDAQSRLCQSCHCPAYKL